MTEQQTLIFKSRLNIAIKKRWDEFALNDCSEHCQILSHLYSKIKDDNEITSKNMHEKLEKHVRNLLNSIKDDKTREVYKIIVCKVLNTIKSALKSVEYADSEANRYLLIIYNNNYRIVEPHEYKKAATFDFKFKNDKRFKSFVEKLTFLRGCAIDSDRECVAALWTFIDIQSA